MTHPTYPHAFTPLPATHGDGDYCEPCRRIAREGDALVIYSACRRHEDYPTPQHPAVLDIRPGDVWLLPYGIHNEMEAVTVHSVHRYPTGALSLRTRPTSNPRAVDSSQFIDHEVYTTPYALVSRGVARVDSYTRSMLPG